MQIFGREKARNLKTEGKQENKPAINIGGSISESLGALSETVGFDTQQLLWLIKDNMKAFEQMAESFYEMEDMSQQNAASTEEITASINELADTSERLRENILSMDKYSSSRTDY